MIWSFSITARNRDDAVREFGNKLFEHAAHIPGDIGMRLDDAARHLVHVAHGNQTVTLTSSGHFDADGNGRCGVVMDCVARAEEDPQAEFARGGKVPVAAL